MKYHSEKVTLTKELKDKIEKAVAADFKTIKIQLSNNQLVGDDVVQLTKNQLNKLNKARNEKTEISLKLNKNQLKQSKVYDVVLVNLTDEDKENIKQAQNDVLIKLNHSDLIGNDPILVTHEQFKKMVKAYASKNAGVSIQMDKEQVEANINATLDIHEKVAHDICEEERLALLLASKDAGNTGLESEIEKLTAQ